MKPHTGHYVMYRAKIVEKNSYLQFGRPLQNKILPILLHKILL